MRTELTIAFIRAALVTGVLLGFAGSDAHAQGTISDVVAFLMTNQAIPTDDFERDRVAAEVARDTISRALLVNLTSVPITTSSSGFLYRLNPELGTVQRASESFGAFFTERALTPGRGRASLGISATTSEFNHLNGHDLSDGSLITIANTFRDEPAPFDTESLTLNLRTSTMTVLASVGVTDSLEIGGAVPFVRLTLDGERLNVYRGTPLVQASASGTASGIADVAVRAKYTLVSGVHGGVAAAAELRLPTGDEANLLGAGSTSWRLLGVGSVDQGRVGFHGNAGIVRGGVSNEFTFAGALALAVQPKVTLSAEFFGRHVSELRDIALSAQPHPTIIGVDTLRLSAGSSGSTLLTALAGIKWNVSSTLVLGGHIAWPLAERGLTAAITPTIALEYAFPQ
jgi:Putative MetA-pathway of phenol degradation